MDAPRPAVYRRAMRKRPGHTLLELSIVLMLATLFATLAVPSFLRGRHALAVRAARAELVATIAAARSTAILTGGATAVVDMPGSAIWIEAPDGSRIGDARELGHSHGIELEHSRYSRIDIRYDALGIGRLANTSIRIRRGDVTSTITISAYGRVRS